MLSLGGCATAELDKTGEVTEVPEARARPHALSLLKPPKIIFDWAYMCVCVILSALGVWEADLVVR